MKRFWSFISDDGPSSLPPACQNADDDEIDGEGDEVGGGCGEEGASDADGCIADAADDGGEHGADAADAAGGPEDRAAPLLGRDG